jgi:uncharacterized protein with NRDE domain
MCLAIMALGQHSVHPVIIAANRDEFLDRPALALAPWQEDYRIRGGRDLEKGGTWLSFHEDGRWGLITNVRAPHLRRQGAPSRGAFIRDFLLGDDGPIDFIAQLPDLNRFEPFNLVLGHGAEAYHINSIEGQLNLLNPGVHALSNDNLNTPWPKAEVTRVAISSVISQSAFDMDGLFEPLTDRTIYPDHTLPSTGVPLEWEQRLSAAFVEAPDYGTRCSTVAIYDPIRGWLLQERVWDRLS